MASFSSVVDRTEVKTTTGVFVPKSLVTGAGASRPG
jgi:hypothetical protein